MADLTLVLPARDAAVPMARVVTRLRDLVGAQLVLVAVTADDAPIAGVDRQVVAARTAGAGAWITAGLAGADTPLVGWMQPGMADPVGVALALERAARAGHAQFLAKGQPYGRPLRAIAEDWRRGWAASRRHRRLLWDPATHPVVMTAGLWEDWPVPPQDDTFDAWVLATARARQVPVLRFPILAGGH